MRYTLRRLTPTGPYFFVSVRLLCSKGQSLRYSPGQVNPQSLCCGTVCGGGVRDGTMPLVQLSAGFQSQPPLPTSKLGPSGADSQVGGLVYFLGLCGLSNEPSCQARSFSCHCNPHRFFQSEVMRLYFTALEPWVVQCLTP